MVLPRTGYKVAPADEAPKANKQKEQLSCDVYGFLTLRLCEMWSRGRIQPPVRVPFLHIGVAIMFYVVYIVLTIGITLFLLVVVTDKMMTWKDSTFAESYKITMVEAGNTLFELAAKGVIPSEDHHPGVTDKLYGTCQDLNGVPRVYIFYLLLFFWVMRMWNEFKSARDWCMNLWLLPRNTSDDNAPMNEAGNEILCLTLWQKGVLLCFIVGMKLMVFAFVLHIGCVFLILQNSGFGIVLKVVAMQIILGIDEQIVDSLALREASKQLKATNLVLEHNRTMLQQIYWYDGVGGIVFTLLAMLVVLFYTNFRFRNLMYLRSACHAYLRNADGAPGSLFDHFVAQLEM